MAKLEITNMVMVQDPVSGQVVVQERVKSWCGVSFPGGHVEPCETIYDSAIREVFEETGLIISDLIACGFIQWYNRETEDRYFTFFYKTTHYSGELIDSTDEGRVFWTDLASLNQMQTAPNFKNYLPMFLEGKYSEAYCAWDNQMSVDSSADNPWGIIYR